MNIPKQKPHALFEISLRRKKIKLKLPSCSLFFFTTSSQKSQCRFDLTNKKKIYITFSNLRTLNSSTVWPAQDVDLSIHLTADQSVLDLLAMENSDHHTDTLAPALSHEMKGRASC